LKNFECNPLKLTPPALREQIQALINVLGDCATTNLRLGSAESSKARETSPRRNRPSGSWFNQNLDVGSKPESTFGGLLQSALRSLKAARQKADDLQLQLIQVQELLRVSMESIRKLQVELVLLEEQEPAMVDEHDSLRALARQEAAAGRMTQKKELDTQAWQKTLQMATSADKISATSESLAREQGLAKGMRDQCSKLESRINQIQREIEGLVLSASSIRPTPCISTLPSSETALSLLLRLPCQCCNKLWVDMATVPLSCGCLFYPYCLWKLVLAGSVTCLGCLCKISDQ
jgi:hypothetical protein